MEYVAYNYFPTPSDLELERIANAVYESDLSLSHLGKNDPPKKWAGSKTEFLDVLRKGTDLTNYTHSRAKDNGVEIDFTIHNDPRWESSSISISGDNREYVESLCVQFSKHLNSYMCISGQLGLGSNQQWNILAESDQCPSSLREKVKNA
jgi:hypothetical protein